jgi:hypothetical protein
LDARAALSRALELSRSLADLISSWRVELNKGRSVSLRSAFFFHAIDAGIAIGSGASAICRLDLVRVPQRQGLGKEITHDTIPQAKQIVLVNARPLPAGYRCCACAMLSYRPAAIRFLHYGRDSLDPLLTACLDCRLISQSASIDSLLV